MTIKRDIELIEDGRRYKQALLDIAKLVDGPHRYKSHQIMDIIIEAKAAFGEHAPESGPWPTLTGHIARCSDCEPSENIIPQIAIQSITLCLAGKKLMNDFYGHQLAMRSKANREALK